MKEYVVDGRYYFPDLESACKMANEIFYATGVFVAVEAV